MIRMACADLERVVVVREDGLTMIYQADVMPRDEWLSQVRTLLDVEELAMLRRWFGVSDLDDLRQSLPVEVCLCWVPAGLRATVREWTCPLHSD